MVSRVLDRPRLSARRSLPGQTDTDGVNNVCHGNTDGVVPNDRAILANVRVAGIFWGRFYDDHPDALTAGSQLLQDLVEGPFFNGLAQYGVGRGEVLGTGRFQFPDTPATLNEDQARDVAKLFANNSGFGPPSLDESGLLYVIFLPVETKPTISSGQDDFSGYHGSTKINDGSVADDLFYAIIRTDVASYDRTTGESLIRSVSFCVSHEIAEAATDRDTRGYRGPKTGCEIGDLCEQNGNFQYRGWQVEQYWSEWEPACIKGNNPVSLSRFLQVINFTGESLRALGTPIINIEFIASRLRPP